MKKILLAALIFIVVAIFAVQAQAATNLKFTWNTSTGATGYHVYTSSTSTFTKASTKVCTGVTALTCTVNGIEDGLKYYAATAYDAAGNESDFSVPISYNGDTTAPPVPGAFQLSVIVNVTINP